MKNQLTQIEEDISEKFVITKVLMSLPDCYKHFVSAWESVPDDKHKNLVARLLMEEQLKTKKEEAMQSTSSAFVAREIEKKKASLKEIEKLNSESVGPEGHRARYGLTPLSDMSKVEFRDIHLSDEKISKAPDSYAKSWINKRHHHNHEAYNVVRRKRASLPLYVDWRLNNTVGPIKNQGLCGACWAYSTVGVIETMAGILTGKMQSLSVQEVIDCARLGNAGCLGGDICLLLDWLLITKSPLINENNYPIRAMDGVCSLKKNVTGVTVTSFTCDDFVGAEDKILEAIANHGPVAVAVNALTWQNYLGGVIQYHCSGKLEELNHAVELVGYDLSGDVPYYIAKNSWGTEFGNEGYLNLAIGMNVCGLASEVATVDVKV
ncbi:Cathepsin O [Eumeta japonica]|uniref:Cathepsin O n=1 Tax=Eumeta variegata TaxID=151549 RepID=A0A4C1TV98_EUMVA|nr:Cathepsin O [Eumeta japonica]